MPKYYVYHYYSQTKKKDNDTIGSERPSEILVDQVSGLENRKWITANDFDYRNKKPFAHNTGKWVIKYPRGSAELDTAWARIIEGVQKGKIGSAKISSVDPAFSDQVIYIETTSAFDLEEIFNVYDFLVSQETELTSKPIPAHNLIGYKQEDLATFAETEAEIDYMFLNREMGNKPAVFISRLTEAISECGRHSHLADLKVKLLVLRNDFLPQIESEFSKPANHRDQQKLDYIHGVIQSAAEMVKAIAAIESKAVQEHQLLNTANEENSRIELLRPNPYQLASEGIARFEKAAKQNEASWKFLGKVILAVVLAATVAVSLARELNEPIGVISGALVCGATLYGFFKPSTTDNYLREISYSAKQALLNLAKEGERSPTFEMV